MEHTLSYSSNNYANKHKQNYCFNIVSIYGTENVATVYLTEVILSQKRLYSVINWRYFTSFMNYIKYI